MKFVTFLLSMLFSASTFAALTAFTYTAPTSPNASPAVATLANVVSAVKSTANSFTYVDNIAASAVDTAATNLTLAVKIAHFDTGAVNSPTYANGAFSWTNNFTTALTAGWVQTDAATYDQKALDFRDAAGTFVLGGMMKGESGINRVLSELDGTARTVVRTSYTPTSNYNALVDVFNAAVSTNTKLTALNTVKSTLTSIRAQALAIETVGNEVITVMNNTLLVNAARDSASFANLDALLTYHALQ